MEICGKKADLLILSGSSHATCIVLKTLGKGNASNHKGSSEAPFDLHICQSNASLLMK